MEEQQVSMQQRLTRQSLNRKKISNYTVEELNSGEARKRVERSSVKSQISLSAVDKEHSDKWRKQNDRDKLISVLLLLTVY